MTQEQDKNRIHLLSLADALFDDLMEESDDQVLAEFQESGGDPSEHAAQMRERFTNALNESKKARLASVRKRMRASTDILSSRLSISVDEARARIKEALATQESAGLTLAARFENENEMSADEIFDLVDDLMELGLIDVKGQK